MKNAYCDDTRQILNLMHIYCEHLDYARFDQINELFRHAAIYMPGDVEPSVPAGTLGNVLKEWVMLDPNTGTPKTRHLTTNHIIEFESDMTAISRSSFTVLQQTETLPLQIIIVGEYHDKFARTENTWAFTERRELITLTGDLSSHLRHPVPAND